ncbi:MAG: AAA family ATPase [Alphaproteobacteria bacterium]|nr:AAA family ATPase [Alphaproteobacteria bacterium]
MTLHHSPLDSKNSSAAFKASLPDGDMFNSPPAEPLLPPLKAYTLPDFIRLPIPPRENLLAPIIQTQSLSMLYAKRGVGKTHIALGIGYAIATGGTILKWQAPTSRPVLYLDGEMSASTMQDRLKKIVEASGHSSPPEGFSIITPDMQPSGMPDLATREGQALIEPHARQAEFIIVDNIATLARTGKENESEGWRGMQEWALRQRSSKKSILFIHHAGKDGRQRGTSSREDVLDLVIRLEHSKGYNPKEGAMFEVHYDKARHLLGSDANPFEATLEKSGQWSFRDLQDALLKRALELQAEGLSMEEIGEQLGKHKSTVSRMLSKYA